MGRRFVAVLVVVRVCAALFAGRKATPEAGAVVELDGGESLEATLNATDLALVNFYAPWCAHCKRFEDQYEKAAKSLADDEVNILLAALDGSEHRDAYEKHGVRAFPHLKLFRAGRFVGDYEGPLEAVQLTSWARRRARPEVTEIHDWPDARGFLGRLLFDDSLQGLVIAVLSSNTSAAARSFMRVAAADDGDKVAFALTTQESLVLEALRRGGGPPPDY